MVQRGLRGERHGVALGTKPPQNFLGETPPRAKAGGKAWDRVSGFREMEKPS